MLWLQTFLRLPGGIPSHDTFNRVFAALDPEEMERGFAARVSSIAKLTAGEVVTIDTMGYQREIAQRIIEKQPADAIPGQRGSENGIRRRGKEPVFPITAVKVCYKLPKGLLPERPRSNTGSANR
jgi:hypothetical protein